jgi:hypothetical protein
LSAAHVVADRVGGVERLPTEFQTSLLTPVSILNMPSPMTLLRTPDSPGHSGRKAASAAAGLAKMSGPMPTPLTMAFLGLDALGLGPFGTASPSMFQLVAQVKPLSSVIGKPLVQRKMPETCHPPIKASSSGPAFQIAELLFVTEYLLATREADNWRYTLMAR